MSRSVDFLPPEARPKRKPMFAAAPAVAYTKPQAEAVSGAPSSEQQGGWLQRFGIGVKAAVPQPAAQSAARKAAEPLQAARQTLLETRTSKPAAALPTASPARTKAAAPGWLARLKQWWAHRQSARPSEPILRAAPPAPTTPQASMPTGGAPAAAVQSVPAKAGVKEPVTAAPSSQPTAPEAAIQPPAAAPAPTFANSSEPLFSTNLMRGQEFEFFDWQRALGIQAAVLGITVVIIAAATWYLHILAAVPAKTAAPQAAVLAARQDEMAELDRRLKEYDVLRRQAQQARTLLGQHVYWTNFFSFLEGATLPNVWYEEFQGDLAGEYVLKAYAVDFDTFVRQLEHWSTIKEALRGVAVDGVEIGETGDTGGEVIFDVTLTVDPAVFTYSQL